MKKTILLLILLVIPFVYAVPEIEVDIDVKPSFEKGEGIAFFYNILSDEDISVSYMPIVLCPNSPLPLFHEERTKLKAGIPFSEKYIYIPKLDDNFEPEKCKAFLQIINPIEKTVKKEFTINILPSFNFNIILCTDTECLEQAKSFVRNQIIYVDYSPNIPDIIISAILKSPTGKIKQLGLPASIKAEQIGTYNLEVTASKEGYKEKTINEQFGVIEKEIKIDYLRVNEVSREDDSVILLWTFFGIVTIGIILLIYFEVKRGRSG